MFFNINKFKFQVFTKLDTLAVMEGNIPLSIRYIPGGNDHETADCDNKSEKDLSSINLACNLHAPTGPLLPTALPLLTAPLLPTVPLLPTAPLLPTSPVMYDFDNQIHRDMPTTPSVPVLSLYPDTSPPSYEEVMSQSNYLEK